MGESLPDETVVVRWTLERQDFVEAMRIRPRTPVLRPSSIVFALMLGVLAVVFALVARAAGAWPPAREDAPLLAAAVLLALALTVLLVWLAPARVASRLWRRNPLLREPHEAVLGTADVTFRTTDGARTLRWAELDEVSDAGRSYRLHMRGSGRPGVFFLIPKRAMPGPDGGQKLGELLRRHVSG